MDRCPLTQEQLDQWHKAQRSKVMITVMVEYEHVYYGYNAETQAFCKLKVEPVNEVGSKVPAGAIQLLLDKMTEDDYRVE